MTLTQFGGKLLKAYKTLPVIIVKTENRLGLGIAGKIMGA